VTSEFDIEDIRNRVRAGHYLVKRDAILHAIKESFNRRDMVEAILTGRIIEHYPDRQRVLVCGETSLSVTTMIYLHIVCEMRDPIYVEFVTAYIPDETIWENPPFRRRRK